MIITMSDVRAAGGCAYGTRAFFKRYGLDYRDFIHNGIAASKIAHIDSVVVKRVLEVARERRK